MIEENLYWNYVEVPVYQNCDTSVVYALELYEFNPFETAVLDILEQIQLYTVLLFAVVLLFVLLSIVWFNRRV